MCFKPNGRCSASGERHPEKIEEYTRGEDEYRRERQRPGRQKGKRKERIDKIEENRQE